MEVNKVPPILIDLFENEYKTAVDVSKLTDGGSMREYYRLSNGNVTVVGVVSEDTIENDIFFSLDKVLEKEGINVPNIIRISEDKKAYLLQDLGDTSLFSLLSGDERMELSRRALKLLVRFQTLPEKVWINEVGYKPLSERLVRWDLNYFKYDYLKPAKVLFDEEKLEDDFDKLVEKLTNSMVTGFMYRDFQSRNIMIKDKDFYLIDFQGARKGPLVYDAVSYIWQAKAPFTFEEREELEQYYIQELRKVLKVESFSLEKQMEEMKVFRILQVLGAYGFRGLIERKPHFLESIPFALRNLDYLRKKGMLKDYPEIERIAEKLNENLEDRRNDENGQLVLQVFSFSYKKGYPEDKSGNGGGFMFDCRAIHNPGRYDEYKTKTGLDKEVIEFLERTSEARDFVENAVKIVIPSVERYLKRGFTSLQVGFGCTGGQHRSVYCAEKFAKTILRKFPEIKVVVNHREQSITCHL